MLYSNVLFDPIRMSYSNALFECLIRMLYSNALFQSSIRMPFSNVLFECPIRMLCSNAIFECSIRMLYSNTLFECSVRMPYSNVLFEYSIPMPCLNTLFECPIRMLYSNALFDCSVRMVFGFVFYIFCWCMSRLRSWGRQIQLFWTLTLKKTFFILPRLSYKLVTRGNFRLRIEWCYSRLPIFTPCVRFQNNQNNLVQNGVFSKCFDGAVNRSLKVVFDS